MRAAARALGQRIREEDGIGRAVEQLEAWGLLQPALSVAPAVRIEQQAVA